MIQTAVRYLLLYGKMADSSLLDVSIHDHCKTCFQRNCTTFADNTDCCEMMDCREECGARFHGCKQLDHSMVCRNAKVHCVNHSLGCPIVLPRSKLGKHLETCPASVVFCTMEWNRWPSFSRERPHRDGLRTISSREQGDQQQLDVALALRDQRMLNESLKLPRKVHRALRNSLTRRYPAMPFAQSSSNRDKSVSNDTSATVSDDGSDAPWEVYKHPPGLQKSICDKLFTVAQNSHPLAVLPESALDSGGGDSLEKDVETQAEEITPRPPSPPPAPNIVRLSLDLTVESVPRYQTKPKSMYTFLCAQGFRRDEYCSHMKNIHSDIHPGVNGWMEERCPLANAGCTFSFRRFCPNDQGFKLVHSEVNESFGVSTPVPNENLAVESNLDCDLTETTNCDKMDFLFTDYQGILSLPFEILQAIARCLDAFSLRHLAVTCKRMREVCCSLLEERGVVILQWEKNPGNVKPMWEISYKRWFFSSAFTPVNRWRFTGHNPISEHLKVCPFNKTHPQQTEKVLLPGMLDVIQKEMRKAAASKRRASATTSTDF